MSTFLKRLAGPIKAVRRTGATILRLVPRILRGARSTAGTATAPLRNVPDSSLAWLGAGSVALGAGLLFSGRSRLAMTATLVPAIVIGATIALRGRATERPAELPAEGR